MLYLQSYQGFRIDRSLVYGSYPQDRNNTQVIYRFALAQAVCINLYLNTWGNNCKQNMTSLSLLAGRTVHLKMEIKHMCQFPSSHVLAAEPGKLDIKRREPGIRFISLSIGSHFKTSDYLRNYRFLCWFSVIGNVIQTYNVIMTW